MPTKLYTATELAKLLQVTRDTVYHWARNGKLRFRKLGGQRMRFDAEDVERFLNGEKVKATAVS